MRFLANENFPARAVAEARVHLTFDKDFGELAFRRRLPATCGIVLFRVATPSAADVARFVVAALTPVRRPRRNRTRRPQRPAGG